VESAQEIYDAPPFIRTIEKHEDITNDPAFHRVTALNVVVLSELI
jgi:hypothetical protein